MSETTDRARALLVAAEGREARFKVYGPDPAPLIALMSEAPDLIDALCDEVDAAVAERAALRAVVCIDCGGTGSKRPNVGSTILYPPGTHCDKCGGSGAVIVKGDK